MDTTSQSSSRPPDVLTFAAWQTGPSFRHTSRGVELTIRPVLVLLSAVILILLAIGAAMAMVWVPNRVGVGSHRLAIYVWEVLLALTTGVIFGILAGCQVVLLMR